MTFNWIHYKELNPDLVYIIQPNEKKMYDHYIKEGKNQGRKYNIYMEYPDFNWNQYRDNYSDLYKLKTREKCENHWLEFGRNENRTYKNIISELYPDFNWIQYKENYHKNYNNLIKKQDCIKHWLNYGCKNNLTYLKINNTIDINQGITQNNIIDKNTQYIMIIDIPSQFEGGVKVFINNIIVKYKSIVSLLILKNNNNMIEFYINNIVTPIKKLVYNDAITLLEQYKDNIIKIFVNHMMDYNTFFINKLFKMNKNITMITHDFYSITTKANPYYQDIIKLERNNILIPNYNMIITQNNKNLLVFNKFIKPNQDIVIVPLPDYNKSDKMIQNDSNKKITVLFIGHISTIKGSGHIKNIINRYNKEFEFIIFGSINIIIDIKCYPYNSIDEFNNLLILYQPNIIIETSIAPETYSLTLTLMMLTQLPIIYFKKSFDSVIEDRLKDYTKSYSINNIIGLDKIILDKKQDFFYTINNTLYYDKFWDNYFSSS